MHIFVLYVFFMYESFMIMSLYAFSEVCHRGGICLRKMLYKYTLSSSKNAENAQGNKKNDKLILRLVPFSLGQFRCIIHTNVQFCVTVCITGV